MAKQNDNEPKKGGLEVTSAIFPTPRPVACVHVPLYTVSKMHIPTIMIILWQELSVEMIGIYKTKSNKN